MNSSDFSTPFLSRIETSPTKLQDAVLVVDPISVQLYDQLYEHWQKPTRDCWSTFFIDNDIHSVQFCNKMKPFFDEKDNEFVGYWFFKQRADRRKPVIRIHNNKYESTTHDIRSNMLLVCRRSRTWHLTNESLNENLPDLLTLYIKFNKDTQDRLQKLFVQNNS